jgi:hypothetical protein
MTPVYRNHAFDIWGAGMFLLHIAQHMLDGWETPRLYISKDMPDPNREEGVDVVVNYPNLAAIRSHKIMNEFQNAFEQCFAGVEERCTAAEAVGIIWVRKPSEAERNG